MPLLHPGITNRMWNDTPEDYWVQFFNWHVEGKAQRPRELAVVAKQVSRSQVVTQQAGGKAQTEWGSHNLLPRWQHGAANWPNLMATMMVNYVSLTGCPRSGQTLFLSVSVQVFLNEITLQIGVLSKAYALPQSQGGITQPVEGLNRMKRTEENWILFLPNYWSWDINFLLPLTLLVLQPSDTCWNLHHEPSGSQDLTYNQPSWFSSIQMAYHGTSQPP